MGLVEFNQFGDCDVAMLRPGNVHSERDWREVLEPILACYQRPRLRRYLRSSEVPRVTKGEVRAWRSSRGVQP